MEVNITGIIGVSIFTWLFKQREGGRKEDKVRTLIRVFKRSTFTNSQVPEWIVITINYVDLTRISDESSLEDRLRLVVQFSFNWLWLHPTKSIARLRSKTNNAEPKPINVSRILIASDLSSTLNLWSHRRKNFLICSKPSNERLSRARRIVDEKATC